MCDEPHSLLILSVTSWIKCINSFGGNSRSVNARPLRMGNMGPHDPPSTILVISDKPGTAFPVPRRYPYPLCGSSHWITQRRLCSPGAGPGQLCEEGGGPPGRAAQKGESAGAAGSKVVTVTLHSWACFFSLCPPGLGSLGPVQTLLLFPVAKTI